jgi:hypothetical protein
MVAGIGQAEERRIEKFVRRLVVGCSGDGSAERYRHLGIQEGSQAGAVLQHHTQVGWAGTKWSGRGEDCDQERTRLLP